MQEKCCNGFSKTKEAKKIIDVLKVVGWRLVGKVNTPDEALAYPLTKILSSLADLDNTLRQGTKATLRNHLIEESNACCNLKNEELADWFIDGMADVAAINVAATREDYAKKFFEFCKPPKTKFNRLCIMFDSYRDSSIKQMTKLKRG